MRRNPESRNAARTQRLSLSLISPPGRNSMVFLTFGISTRLSIDFTRLLRVSNKNKCGWVNTSRCPKTISPSPQHPRTVLIPSFRCCDASFEADRSFTMAATRNRWSKGASIVARSWVHIEKHPFFISFKGMSQYDWFLVIPPQLSPGHPSTLDPLAGGRDDNNRMASAGKWQIVSRMIFSHKILTSDSKCPQLFFWLSVFNWRVHRTWWI